MQTKSNQQKQRKVIVHFAYNLPSLCSIRAFSFANFFP